MSHSDLTGVACVGGPSRWVSRFSLAMLWMFLAPCSQVGAWAEPPADSFLKRQQRTPSMRWLSRQGPVHSLLYEGEQFQGKSTEVFAFYASPSTIAGGDSKAEEASYPGVVLIHGGGGTAFAEWVLMWAKRGYAAIAMDLAGSRPPDPKYDTAGQLVPQRDRSLRKRLPNGGPFHGRAEKFDSIGGDHTDDWPYHAMASVIRAHSLLRSFDEVDAQRTAVTGISWGGYTTCLVASLDSRFNAAAPVYGCGFLYEGESVQKPAIDNLGDRRQAWVEAYDPSQYLKSCRVPMLMVNGTNDIHYPLDSYQRSYDAIPGPKRIRIEVNMRHSHPAGWAPREIADFIDSHCRSGAELPLPSAVIQRNGDTIQLFYKSQLKLKSAQLHYTTDTGLRSKRKWMSREATFDKDTITAPAPPVGANTWFVSVTDMRGAMVTTPIQFSDAE